MSAVEIIDDGGDVDAAVELSDLYQRDGKLTAESVLAHAADPDSVLHARIEWDDTIAAHEYRLEQCRAIIRSVRIIDHDRPVRAFVFLKSAGSYTPIDHVLRDEDWRAEIIEQFLADAERFKQRWANHKFVADEYQRWLSGQQP